MQSGKQWRSTRLGRKADVSIGLKYIIPIILGLLVIVFYMIFFGPASLVSLLNSSFNASFQNI